MEEQRKREPGKALSMPDPATGTRLDRIRFRLGTGPEPGTPEWQALQDKPGDTGMYLAANGLEGYRRCSPEEEEAWLLENYGEPDPPDGNGGPGHDTRHLEGGEEDWYDTPEGRLAHGYEEEILGEEDPEDGTVVLPDAGFGGPDITYEKE